MKQFEYHGVEAEKAEAMRRYNNRRSFRNMLRLAAVAFLCYLWFSTVAVFLQTVAGLIYRFASSLITDRTVAFVIANLLVVLIFLLSGESDDEKSTSSNEPDLYDQYTSSFSAVTVTVPDEKVVVEVDVDSNKQIVVPTAEVEEAVTTKKDIVPANVVEYDESSKQIVPAYFPEVSADETSEEKAVTTTTGVHRRTKSEAKKKKSRAVTEYRRTESANEVEMERLSSEEFRLKVESFIMERKRSLIHDNDVVEYSRSSSHGLVATTATSDGYGYGSGSVSW